MFLDNVVDDTDEERRKLYVGMTRAKNSLYIHHSGTLFGSIKTESLNRIEDRKHYDKPSEIVLNLTLADVNLGFVSGKKKSSVSFVAVKFYFLRISYLRPSSMAKFVHAPSYQRHSKKNS